MLEFTPPAKRGTEDDISVSSEVASRIEPIRAGWGACRSCNCKGYTKGKGDNMCGTCGHHWKQHR